MGFKLRETLLYGSLMFYPPPGCLMVRWQAELAASCLPCSAAASFSAQVTKCGRAEQLLMTYATHAI
jgi:hypothetical protein